MRPIFNYRTNKLSTGFFRIPRILIVGSSLPLGVLVWCCVIGVIRNQLGQFMSPVSPVFHTEVAVIIQANINLPYPL